ncbi:MAG TPA: alpha/beta fold hydrolase [Planctomycetota bacterium]|nr:alpha/beta fold hydrolase [Planctomycetota bacterium]
MLLRSALLAALLLLGGIGDRFVYWPMKYPLGDWSAPARIGLRVEERELRSSDGVKLSAWWAPRPGARAAVLFLHGNGGNLTHCARRLKELGERLDASVFAVDYRGYGKSAGSPSEAGLYRDAEAAYEELVGPLGVSPGRLIIYGHSLGTAVATELALRRPCAALALEAPFTAIPAMVKRAVPFLDPKDLVSERYDTIDKIGRLTVPLLVIHGTADRTIPFEMGRAVFDAAPEPKTFLEVPGGGHVDCPEVAPAAFYGALEKLEERAIGAGAAAGKGEPALF